MFKKDYDEMDSNFEKSMPIGNRLTLEEVEIALNFLQRRFPGIKLEKLILTLDNYHQRKSSRAPLKRLVPQSQRIFNQRSISPPLMRVRQETQMSNQLRQVEDIAQAPKSQEELSIGLFDGSNQEQDVNSTQQSVHYLIP